MATKTFDAVVVGGGPGGYVAAIRLAQLGKRTALVEKGSLGGACLNWGCIPSKALISAANLVEEIRGAADRGILVAPPQVDIERLRAFKDGVVKKLVSGIGQLEKGNGVEVLKGTATFVGPGAIEVAAGGEVTRVEAPAFVVATGGHPVQIPGLEFGPDVWGAAEALALPEVPGRLVVVGGGVIGLELGTVYAKLGSRVTVVEALPTILAGADVDAVRIVQKGLRQRGIQVLVQAKAKGLARAGGALQLTVEVDGKEQVLEADRLLVAVGFRPNTAGIGLEAAGVALDARGFIAVDDQLRTNVPGIFAIGDVNGPPFLAHTASREAETVAEVIAGHDVRRDWVAVPAAIFTDPELATVGLNEEDARGRGLDPLVGKFAFAGIGRAVAMDHTEGFVKVVGDRASRRILGVTIVGPEASDLIAEAALAVEMGATLQDVALTIHAHPTLAEAFHEACKAAMGEAIHALNRPERPRREKAAAPAGAPG